MNKMTCSTIFVPSLMRKLAYLPVQFLGSESIPNNINSVVFESQLSHFVIGLTCHDNKVYTCIYYYSSDPPRHYRLNSKVKESFQTLS